MILVRIASIACVMFLLLAGRPHRQPAHLLTGYIAWSPVVCSDTGLCVRRLIFPAFTRLDRKVVD